MPNAIDFTFDVDVSKLLLAFDKALLETSKLLRQQMSIGMRTVAADARVNHRFHHRKHNLERSVKWEVSPDGLEGKVYLSSRDAPYAAIVHNGTLKKNYPIRAKRKKALHFVSGGDDVFIPKKRVVIHPGLRPDKFLFEAFNRQKPYLLARMRGAVLTAYRMAGFK
jgi:hypothetical protein